MNAKLALSENLTRIRKEKGYTQEALVKKIIDSGNNITQATLSRIETGKLWPEHPTLANIAVALEVEETDLTSEPELLKLMAAVTKLK